MKALIEGMEKRLRQIVQEETAKSKRKEPEDSHFGSREGHVWTKAEEDILIHEVRAFIDSTAVTHRRAFGGILARLNKLIADERLGGLRDNVTRSKC